ncbi:MAG: hypothetical protein ACFNT9_06565 [Rodentibacter sp.]
MNFVLNKQHRIGSGSNAVLFCEVISVLRNCNISSKIHRTFL